MTKRKNTSFRKYMNSIKHLEGLGPDRIKFLLDLNDELKLPLEPLGYTPEEFQRMREEENRFIFEVCEHGKILYG